MKKQLAPWCFAVLLSCQISALQAVSNLDDRLSTPSRKAANPSSELLIDVQRNGQRLVAVGARGIIILSDDGGASWRQAAVPVSVTLVALHFPDDKYGWAVGHGGVVLGTKDGGESWAVQFDGTRANALVVAQAKDRLAALQSAFDSADAGDIDSLRYQLEEARFALEDAQIDAGLGPSKPLLDVWFKNRQQGFVVGAYGYFFATNDGGETWKNYGARLDNFDRFHLNAIDSISGGILMIVGEGGQIFVSHNSGEDWESIVSPYYGSFFGLQGTGRTGEVLVFGLRGHVFRSMNAGQSWEELTMPSELTLNGATNLGQGKLALVGQSGSVLLSRDYGQSFTRWQTSHLDGFSGVVGLDGQRLLLVGEQGIRVAKN
ncbi:MAG: YCF48-related protein [Oleiphilaceae bacterium]|nr:YCF48-related protein [Oleiphilaceae bacterium]